MPEAEIKEHERPAANPAADLAAPLADAYAKWRGSTVGRITDALEARLLLDLAGPVAGLRVLDVGCGDGALALELWRRGARVTGIDAAPAMIAAARERARREGARGEGADVTFAAAAAQALPFPADDFDLVVAVTLLCFVADAGPVMRELARVVRPGGRVVIGELHNRSSWAVARRIRGWLGSPVWRRATFRSAREMRRLAAGAGLTVERLRGAVYYPRFALAARLLGPLDHLPARVTTNGAAFIALAAVKPVGGPAGPETEPAAPHRA
jgi:SAM-dependent methyltransferase